MGIHGSVERAAKALKHYRTYFFVFQFRGDASRIDSDSFLRQWMIFF